MTLTVSNSIFINAPREVVWVVTQDVEHWPEWTPTVTSITRMDNKPFGIGSVARIKQPMQPESDWVVTEFSPGRRFVWQTRRTGLQMVGTHELIAEGSGTKNVLRVAASGALAVLLWPMLRLAMRKALADENRGLKARCEQTA